MKVIAKHSKLQFVEKVDECLSILFQTFSNKTYVSLSTYAEISMNYHMGIKLNMNGFEHNFWFDSENVSDKYAEEIAYSIFGMIVAEYAKEIIADSFAILT